MGCKDRVGNSLGSVSKITKVGLAKRKEKKEAKRQQHNKKECTPVTISVVVQESLPTSFETWQV